MTQSRPKFTLLQGGKVFAPESLGQVDVLVFGRVVVDVGEAIEPPTGSFETERVDVSGLIVVPGLIDGHCHPTGAGGTSAPETRAPGLTMASLAKVGITTIVGMLGGDGLTRQPLELIAKVRGLQREGIRAYLLAGAYRVPPPTVTGDLQRDVYLVSECLGAGEIAISDERGSQPTLHELARIVADANAGARHAGKKGITNFHLGTGKRGLEPLRRLRDETDLPLELLIPTHLNRSEALFSEAIEWCKAGGIADLTVSLEDHLPGTVPTAEAITRLWQAGVDPRQVTLSTDAGGVFPVMDQQGERRLLCWSSGSLLEGMRRVHHAAGVPLSQAVALATRNVALSLGIPDAGEIASGKSADLVVLDSDLNRVVHVWARGEQLVRHEVLIKRETFDRPDPSGEAERDPTGIAVSPGAARGDGYR